MHAASAGRTSIDLCYAFPGHPTSFVSPHVFGPPQGNGSETGNQKCNKTHFRHSGECDSLLANMIPFWHSGECDSLLANMIHFWHSGE